ncbi:MAG: radical SAM protein [Anaerolineae bacterium]
MNTLKIDMTYQCTAQCAHCRFGCTTMPQPVLPRSLARQVMSDLVRLNKLELVVLLGGEPGLFPARMLEILGDAAALGLRTRLETNAFWALDEASARAFLQPLRSLNTQVSLSLDAFHAPYVPPERVGWAVRVLEDWQMDYGIETGFVDIEQRSHPSDVTSTRLLAELEAFLGHAVRGHIYQGPLFYVGRCARTLAGAVAEGRGVPQEACPAVPWWSHSEQDTLELINLDAEGYLSKGCGIAFGNARERSVAEILAGYNARQHPIIGRLLEGGPLALVEEARELGYILKPDYADRCQLCQEVREVLRPRYPHELAPEQHYRR